MGNRGHRKRRLKAQEADAFTKVCFCLWGSLGGRSERSLDQSSVLCKVGWEHVRGVAKSSNVGHLSPNHQPSAHISLPSRTFSDWFQGPQLGSHSPLSPY